MKERVLHHYRDVAGHPERDETLDGLKDRYYWQYMAKDVREYVKHCTMCRVTKRGPPQEKPSLKPRQPTYPWHTISVDINGPYPRTSSGKRFILVISDIFTRWVEAFVVDEAKIRPIVNLLENQVFTRYGYPHTIISDNGPQFRGDEWQGILGNGVPKNT